MDVAELRKRAKKARNQFAREKLALIEQTMTAATGLAEDRIHQRLRTGWEELDKAARTAADLGRRDAVLVRLSSQLYDLRQAVLAELHESTGRSPDPYPQLRREGPFAFRDVDRWLRDELQFADPQHTSPLLWLDHLARWVQRQENRSGLARLLGGGPPIDGELKRLYLDCQQRKLKPRFEMYHQFEDTGVALIVAW